MRIYIDEAGLFTAPRTRADSYSLVLALVIPSAAEPELFYDFLRLRDSWPVKGIEIKGSRLDETQTAQVIDILLRYDVLVQFKALNVADHGHQRVEDFKRGQADALLAHLTPQHQPTMVQSLQQMADAIRKMPNQLFLQAFATIVMLLDLVEHVTLYYVQRVPEELGDISWTIDRKDRTITQMEDMWSTLIAPMSETHSIKEPLPTLRGADYSHFNKRYAFTKNNTDPEMARHMDWLREVHGLEPFDEDDSAVDIGKLYREQREFKDSRACLGLQLADILATTLRRALNGNLQRAGWNEFGRLLIRRRNIGSYFLQLGPSNVRGRQREGRRMFGYAVSVCQVLQSKAKPMLTPVNAALP